MLSLKVFSCKLTSLYCKQTQKIVSHWWQESTSFKGRTFLTPQTPNGKNLWLLPDQSNRVFLLSSSKAILRHLDSYFLLPFRWTSFSLLLAPSCFFRHFCNSDKKELKIPLIVAPFLSLLQFLAWQLFSSAKNRGIMQCLSEAKLRSTRCPNTQPCLPRRKSRIKKKRNSDSLIINP